MSHDERTASLGYIAPSALMRSQVNAWLRERGLDTLGFISVHARLGDYRSFANGSFFFDPCFYLDLCRELRNAYKKKVLLFTNEPEQFVAVDDGTLLVDVPADDIQFSLLQSSALIVGPPSTYSSLAAEIGLFVNEFERGPCYVQIRSDSLHDLLSRVDALLGR